MAKLIAIDDNGNPSFIEQNSTKSELVDLSKKINNGIEGIMLWQDMGEDYLPYVKSSFEQTLCAIDLLIDSLKEKSTMAQDFQDEFNRFLQSIKGK